MTFLIFVPPQSRLNGRERSPHTIKWGKTQREKETSWVEAKDSVPMVFLSNMFGIALTLGAKKSLLKHNLKKCAMGQKIKAASLKWYMERLFYRGKTFGKEFSMKKFQIELRKKQSKTLIISKTSCIWRLTYIHNIWGIMKWCVFKT